MSRLCFPARHTLVLAVAVLTFAACNGSLDFRAGAGGSGDAGGSGGAAGSGGAGGRGGAAGGTAGAGCAIDEDCGLASLHCVPSGGGCVECDSDTHCGASGLPRCDRTLHRCVACIAKADCPATQDCLAAHCTTTCVDGATPGCPAGSSCEEGYCYTCGHDGLSCADLPATPFCLSPPWICAGCRNDADCGGSTPRCDPVRHACVRCVASPDCPATARFCDPATGACVAA